jgi:hypothetical protein
MEKDPTPPPPDPFKELIKRKWAEIVIDNEIRKSLKTAETPGREKTLADFVHGSKRKKS